MIVDHVNDPLASLAKAPLPDGVRASTEERNRNTVHFAEVVPTAGESVDQAGKRLVSAFVGLKLPPGDRWAFGKTSDDTVRSFLVAGAPVVTEANVAEASAYLDKSWGTTRFCSCSTRPAPTSLENVTGVNVGSRFAIVFDGRVQSAPVIRSRVGGGRVQIRLDTFATPQEEKAEAERLAHGVSGQ